MFAINPDRGGLLEYGVLEYVKRGLRVHTSFTWIVNVGKSDAFAATGILLSNLSANKLRSHIAIQPYNPESNPTWPVVLVNCSFLHGSAKLDCVAVWFFAINWNVTVSPGWAVIFSGL